MTTTYHCSSFRLYLNWRAQWGSVSEVALGKSTEEIRFAPTSPPYRWIGVDSLENLKDIQWGREAKEIGRVRVVAVSFSHSMLNLSVSYRWLWNALFSLLASRRCLLVLLCSSYQIESSTLRLRLPYISALHFFFQTSDHLMQWPWTVIQFTQHTSSTKREVFISFLSRMRSAQLHGKNKQRLC